MANKANPSNKPVAAVTGVGPGLGAALARRFAATYAVAILARKADYLKALAGEIRQSGATVMDVPCDVGDRAQMARAFDAIRTDLGEPELLLYNAGSGSWGTITEITAEQYEADWRVNALGAFVAAKEVAPAMIARGRGAILFTGATAGVKAGPKSVSFGPAKFAMRGWARATASRRCRTAISSSPRRSRRPTGTSRIRTRARGRWNSKYARSKKNSNAIREDAFTADGLFAAQYVKVLGFNTAKDAMNISISLTPELIDLIKAKVESGRYSSTSEVVRKRCVCSSGLTSRKSNASKG